MATLEKRNRSIPEKIFRFFSSYSLAAITMVLLVIITLLGTFEQQVNGLHLTQKKWYDSFFVTSFEYSRDNFFYLFLPGGFLLMIVLSINLTCGAIISARKNLRAPGMIITHSSILFMLLAGLVSFFGKVEGNMAIFEGDTSNKFQFFHERVVTIEEFDPAAQNEESPPPRKAWVVPMKYFNDLTAEEEEEKSDGFSLARKFTHPDFPFEFTLFGYQQNSVPRLATPQDKDTGRVADDVVLKPIPSMKEEEANMNGIYMDIAPLAGADSPAGKERHILWEGSRETHPLTVNFDDKIYLFKLAKDTHVLPFKVTLNEAIREYHPGTERPKEFRSNITHISSDGSKVERTIEMNHPLREDGWILFQSQFALGGFAKGVGPSRSVLQVVTNPSDHWPLYSLIAASIGLVIHFLQKLIAYSVRASRKRESLAA